MDIEMLYNLFTTMLGVVIGGLITIKASNITNTKLLRKEHQLSILQEVKRQLRDWGIHLLVDAVRIFEHSDIREFRTVTPCPALASAIAYFDTNLSALKPFAEAFRALRRQEISLQLEEDDILKQLLLLADEHGTSVPIELYAHDDAAQLLERYADKIKGLHTGIGRLITQMDVYIETDVLK